MMSKDILKTISRFRQPSALQIKPILIQGPEAEALSTEIGSIKPRPEQRHRGMWHVFLMVVPFLSLGAYFGKRGAGLLEEFEIFVPDDDDDD